jgi:hypothetical protein
MKVRKDKRFKRGAANIGRLRVSPCVAYVNLGPDHGAVSAGLALFFQRAAGRQYP